MLLLGIRCIDFLNNSTSKIIYIGFCSFFLMINSSIGTEDVSTKHGEQSFMSFCQKHTRGIVAQESVESSNL